MVLKRALCQAGVLRMKCSPIDFRAQSHLKATGLEYPYHSSSLLLPDLSIPKLYPLSLDISKTMSNFSSWALPVPSAAHPDTIFNSKDLL